MTESTNVTIKAEQPNEAEIRELAAKMVEANKAKALVASVAAARSQPEVLLGAPAAAAGLSAVGGQNMVILKFLTIKPGTQQQTPAEPRPTFDDKKTPAPDDASWKGHFGWDTLCECHVPYIYRSGEKYVAVRMVPIKLLNKYLNYQHANLYSFTCIQSYYITEIEARLLNDINNRYCDGQFGCDPFTQKDLIVRLMDAYEFYNFLDVCYNKLLSGKTNNNKCGFIMINKEYAVPYTVRNGKKFLPLFYFEGEMDSLKLKAEQLNGWDISYLKFCCKVQGIRNELFTSETCLVISLTDIKSYFPLGTEFEEYWPNKVVDSQLFNSTMGLVSGGCQWIKAPPAPPLREESGLFPDTTIQMAMDQQPTPFVRSTANTTTMKTPYNHSMADQPDEPMDVVMESQYAAACTSASPNADPPTIAAPKSKAQKQREYRQRIAASRTSAQAIAARKSDAERQRNRRLRKAVNLALVSGSLESTTASSSRSEARLNDVQTGTQRHLTHQQRRTPKAAKSAQINAQPGTSDQIEVQQAQFTWNTKWALSIMRFKLTFLDNDFGYACSVCDRLWFKNDLKPITAAQLEVISKWFRKENRRLCREEYEMVCNTCKRSLNKKSMPPLAKFNGFSYPDPPPGLPPLDPISERLISPCLPFMQVRRLRHDLSNGIIGQVINVPVDVQQMVKCLPRKLNEDDVINVNIKRKLAHKSVYISEHMSKSTISAWLTVLQESPLYRLYEINVDLSRLHPTVPFHHRDDIQDDPSNRIENISAENTSESEILASRQHTMMWNEEDCLNIAPGHHTTPFNIKYDRNVEELSFPSIYFGEPRRFNKGVSVSPYMVANSEIRRRDRRGATPQKILYVAMKLLRLRMVDGIYSTFRNVSVTENITRRMLEDTEFLKEYVIQNLAFMKTVPNSVQYWASRKRDLFAMIRQLGKPTAFLTISANEIRWMKLLTILLKLSKKYPGKTAKDLNTSECCTLVSEDPVTCCIYFYKLVGSMMKMLKSKQSYNPFGNYFVKDYFLRIEFQHQGSPRAHILLWLNDDPREMVSENMPRTINLVEKLSSVTRDDLPNNSIYDNQIHKHTFTCTKRGETNCRFGIPYWPMPTTRVLVPMPQSDGRLRMLQQKAKELRAYLGKRQYACMDEFLNANGLTYVSYLDIVRSTLRRPTLVFRRNFDELMTNTFNPYLAGELNSKIDIQFILDEYSCAEYVLEYINKSAREMGNLRRELTAMMQEHPDQDYTGQLKALSIKLLNAVEMSAQEAAWYLLRQPMSEASRQIMYIPTVWPTERQRCRKRRQQMDREGIDGDSTDVWTKNIIQRYEERPACLEQVYLAEFASWYANFNDFVDEEDDVHVDDDEDSEAVPEARRSRAPKEYRRRLLGRVIRYRRYNIDETVNYKREMVLLYVQFRNEMSEILDQNKFLQLFDDNKETIMERHSLFETNLNIENVMKELEAMMILQNDNDSSLQEEESRTAVVQRSLGGDGAENLDDANQIVPRQGFSITKRHCNRSDSITDAAGEVAIYRKLSSTSMSKVRQVALSGTTCMIKNTGDVCLAEITCFTTDTTLKFVLGAAYIHPGASIQNIGMLLYQALVPYVHNSQYLYDPPFLMDIDANVPILSDFNTNVRNDDAFLKYMKDKYNLECVSDVNEPTTLRGTTINFTFSRHITLETLPLISYFSYHRHILNRIMQFGGS